MKLNKLLSVILSASMISASAALPVFADDDAMLFDYVLADYDIVRHHETFDDGTVTNDIDGTAAKQVTDSEIFLTVDSGAWFTTENFFSFDFRFDAEDANISIDKKKSNGNVDKQGPLFSYSSGVFRTQSGGSKWDTLYDGFEINKWYTAEMEGIWVTAGASVTMRLYDEAHTLLATISGVNLRQFYGGSSNGYPDTIRGYNVSIDNIKLISEYPNELHLTAVENEINAGQTTAVSYTATRLEADVTKPEVTWSVYDEAGETEITDGMVSITSEGVVIASIDSPTQVVTVKATAQFGENEPALIGSMKITVNSVDTSAEKFDEIVLSGSATIKSGTSEDYSFTASKLGTDVTDTVTTDDVVWSVYDCDDLNPNNNKNISIENGKLTVADGVIPHKIYIRATSPSGSVYGSLPVDITVSDSQKETVLLANACEESIATATRVESFDGSYAYLLTAATKFTFGDNSDYTITEVDMKFGDENTGMVFQRADGTINSSFFYRNGQLQQQTGSSKYQSLVATMSSDKWYHLKVIYTTTGDASINVYEYAEDGTLGEPITVVGINKRNGKAYGTVELQTGTYVDNVKISVPIADAVEVTAPKQFMFAGETAQFTATATRSGLPLASSGLTWSVLDESGLPIIDESVTVDATGLVSATTEAQPQTVTVVAKTAAGDTASATITIQSSDIFEITNIGINEDMTKIVKIYATKNFYYDNPVAFIVAIYDAESGRMKGVVVNQNYGDSYKIGANEIVVDYTLPSDFDAENDIIKAFVWSGM